ncbi:MAG TPA: hypothetical protein VF607_04575 [Verrucomicrobiae bacterium]
MAHTWRFFPAGGFNQVKLETGADLMHLEELDQKLWVALACPTTGIEFDAKTSALIDTDGDKRIRASELIAAIKWAGSALKNPDLLVKGGDSVAIADIRDEALQASAKQILVNLGKAEATAISLADASDANKIFANTTFNGDGVIILDSTGDAALKAIITDIAACFGAATDRSGKPGIDQAKADAFFAEAAAFAAWQAKADANVLVAGDKTAAAAAAVKAIKTKVDDFFGRCRLAAFDARTVNLVNRSEAEYAAIVSKDLSIQVAEVAGFPLATVAAGKALPLKAGLNPAHAGAVSALLNQAVIPLLGDRAELTEGDWAALQGKLAAYDAWLGAKAGANVEKLGLPRVNEILAAKAQEKINALIAQDKALEPQANSIANVEKLVRYVRDLHLLARNFVNFKDLYSGQVPSIFQCGTLYLDQRSCNLCITVEDAAKHGVMAGLAGAYLAYCDCVRKGTGEKMSILAVFSQGDDDNLMVGRNGIFYDRKGRDYDATITKILANPISLRQAFWAPYKKLVRMIEEQINKRAAAADADVNANLSNATAAATNAGTAKPKIDIGMIAALSVAFGSIGTALAYFLGLFKGVPLWQLPLIVLGIMLAISTPSLILAYMKLRKRNLGPILDANGWAVNAKAKINVPFGTSLTDIAKLPPGAPVDLNDRFAAKSSILPKLAIAALVLACVWSFLNDDEGRLWRWTEGSEKLAPIHNIAKVPAVIQKAMDEEKGKNKTAATVDSTKGVVTETAAAAAAAAPAAPAAPAAAAK